MHLTIDQSRCLGQVWKTESHKQTAHLAPTTDTRVAIDGALVPPMEWKRPKGRSRNTWLSTIKDDLAPLNIGLFSAVQKALDK